MLNYINTTLDSVSTAAKDFVEKFFFDTKLKSLAHDQIDANTAFAKATARTTDTVVSQFAKGVK
jgi:hypothetical protein